jgi:hypothetical protein
LTAQQLQELEQIEQAILEAVGESNGPYPPQELFDILRQRGFNEDLSRAAVWFLVDANMLAFDRYRQLVPAGVSVRNG